MSQGSLFNRPMAGKRCGKGEVSDIRNVTSPLRDSFNRSSEEKLFVPLFVHLSVFSLSLSVVYVPVINIVWRNLWKD